jgi:hypothetical protein
MTPTHIAKRRVLRTDRVHVPYSPKSYWDYVGKSSKWERSATRVAERRVLATLKFLSPLAPVRSCCQEDLKTQKGRKTPLGATGSKAPPMSACRTPGVPGEQPQHCAHAPVGRPS